MLIRGGAHGRERQPDQGVPFLDGETYKVDIKSYPGGALYPGVRGAKRHFREGAPSSFQGAPRVNRLEGKCLLCLPWIHLCSEHSRGAARMLLLTMFGAGIQVLLCLSQGVCKAGHAMMQFASIDTPSALPERHATDACIAEENKQDTLSSCI